MQGSLKMLQRLSLISDSADFPDFTKGEPEIQSLRTVLLQNQNYSSDSKTEVWLPDFHKAK